VLRETFFEMEPEILRIREIRQQENARMRAKFESPEFKHRMELAKRRAHEILKGDAL
jgi:hypothetical protein